MLYLRILFILLIFFSCESRKVKYDGLNDLVIGVDQVVLYENGEFYLELGLGGVEGKYEIKDDRVLLSYDDKPEGWPDELIITEKYFIAVVTRKDGSQYTKQIERYVPVK